MMRALSGSSSTAFRKSLDAAARDAEGKVGGGTSEAGGERVLLPHNERLARSRGCAAGLSGDERGPALWGEDAEESGAGGTGRLTILRPAHPHAGSCPPQARGLDPSTEAHAAPRRHERGHLPCRRPGLHGRRDAGLGLPDAERLQRGGGVPLARCQVLERRVSPRTVHQRRHEPRLDRQRGSVVRQSRRGVLGQQLRISVPLEGLGLEQPVGARSLLLQCSSHTGRAGPAGARPRVPPRALGGSAEVGGCARKLAHVQQRRRAPRQAALERPARPKWRRAGQLGTLADSCAADERCGRVRSLCGGNGCSPIAPHLRCLGRGRGRSRRPLSLGAHLRRQRSRCVRLLPQQGQVNGRQGWRRVHGRPRKQAQRSGAVQRRRGVVSQAKPGHGPVPEGPEMRGVPL